MLASMTPTRIRIRELRDERGWSQLELAERASVRQATISEMETGRVRRVTLDVIDRLAAAFGVQPGELFERTPERKGRRG